MILCKFMQKINLSEINVGAMPHTLLTVGAIAPIAPTLSTFMKHAMWSLSVKHFWPAAFLRFWHRYKCVPALLTKRIKRLIITIT